MAAVVEAAQTTDSRSNPRSDGGILLQGLKHRRFGLLTVTTTGDTMTTGISSIVCVAWESVDTTDPVSVELAVQASGIVGFTTGTNGSTGYLHVWSGL